MLFWLQRDLRSIAPNYYAQLRDRINLGIVSGEQLAEDDPEYDGAALIAGPLGSDVEFWERDQALLLEDQLFPHDGSASDYATLALGLCVVALHSALDSYARALTTMPSKLPSGIEAALQLRGIALTSRMWKTLTDCDATRYIIVHNRGVVDEKYINAVSNPEYHVGEFRVVTVNRVQEFADAVWIAAELLHQHVEPTR